MHRAYDCTRMATKCALEKSTDQNRAEQNRTERHGDTIDKWSGVDSTSTPCLFDSQKDSNQMLYDDDNNNNDDDDFQIGLNKTHISTHTHVCTLHAHAHAHTPTTLEINFTHIHIIYINIL